MADLSKFLGPRPTPHCPKSTLSPSRRPLFIRLSRIHLRSRHHSPWFAALPWLAQVHRMCISLLLLKSLCLKVCLPLLLLVTVLQRRSRKEKKVLLVVSEGRARRLSYFRLRPWQLCLLLPSCVAPRVVAAFVVGCLTTKPTTPTFGKANLG